jgi:MFS family permease
VKKNPIPFPYVAVVIAALYMSQGLPGGLIAHALPVLLREQGSSLIFISALKLLALPWLLKFIWAPLIDGSGCNFERFRWILRMQSLMVLGLVVLSWTVSSISFAAISVAVAILLLINLVSATQDIATDGFTVAQTPEQSLGLANSIQVAAYKVGMLIGGSGLLLLTPYFEIPELIRFLSIVIAVLLLPLLFFKRKYLLAHPENLKTKEIQARSKNALQRIVSTYREFFSQSGIRSWLLVLVTYKVADSLGSTMFKPMLVDSGVLLSDIGYLTIYSTIAGLIGAVLAGLLYRLWGMKLTLVLFGLLQTLSVSSFYAVSEWSLSMNEVYALAIVEQFCDGLSTVILFAVMMRNCRQGNEGADYTLQASLQIALAGIVGACSGVIASLGGYALLYALCAIFGAISFFITLKYIQGLK